MPAVDTERFRLRNFVEKLIECGECEVRNEPIDLLDVAAASSRAIRARCMFKAAGPEKAELVGNVMGSRKRLALALDTDERGLLGTLNSRLNTLQPPVKVSSQQAPVQQVVLKGDDADLMRAAGASAARRRRRALYLRRHRLRAVSRHRLHQCRLPPHHAARAAPGRHRPDRAERHARHLSRSRRAQGAGAGRLCGRLASGGLSRRHDGAAQCRRARHHRRDARPAGAGGEMRHQRHLRAGRRRICHRGLSRSGRPCRAGRPLRRICRLLRRGEAQSGAACHRDHPSRGRAVPDPHHRRPGAGAHRHRAAHHHEDRDRRPGPR